MWRKLQFKQLKKTNSTRLYHSQKTGLPDNLIPICVRKHTHLLWSMGKGILNITSLRLLLFSPHPLNNSITLQKHHVYWLVLARLHSRDNVINVTGCLAM